MDYEMILMEKQGKIGRITLNRPDKLNAINVQMGVEFQDAMDQLEGDDDIRAVILAGAGRSFCAGDDLRGMSTIGYERRSHPDSVKQYVYGQGRFILMVQTMRRFPKPVIGMIRGHAYGGGLNLALACDLRVASENALLATPFIQRAMGTGVNQLHYYVGLGIAMEMVLLGDPIDAYRAERLGLVNRVSPDDKLEETTLELADRLASGPTKSIGYTKAAVHRGWFQDIDTSFEYQGYAQALAGFTEDRQEGGNAFAEKRKPDYMGK